MSFTVLIFLAVGLSMDAFAVSITSGVTLKDVKIRQAFIIALFFGVFQGVMPVFGWLLGRGFNDIISSFDYLVVFLILAFIGSKMIYDSLKKKDEKTQTGNNIKISSLFALAIATSIDAFAVGIGFSLLEIGIIFPSLFIGIVTFVLSFIGVYIGEKLGALFGKRMEILGGIVLIVIAFNVLFENVHIF